MDLQAKLMKKCNLCYDRTSQGLQPWCAQACPTQALWYGNYEEFVNQRRGRPANRTRFGDQDMRTRVYHVLRQDAPVLDIRALVEQARAGLKAGVPAREEAWVL